MSNKANLTAGQVLHCLMSHKHRDDVCVPECKDGQTYTRRNHAKLDLWVLPRSYTPLNMIGYEIKVSRSDFMQDNKWHNYLPMCNQFYFACPWGIISPSEVPEEAGLVWVTKNAARSVIKKKAPFRKIEFPVGLFLYIVMSRAGISDSDSQNNSAMDRVAYWKNWLDMKEESRELGYMVSVAIRNRITAAEKENKLLKKENKSLSVIKDFWLNELGGREHDLSKNYMRSVEATNQYKAQRMKSAVDKDILNELYYLSHHIQEGQSRLTMLKGALDKNIAMLRKEDEEAAKKTLKESSST